MLIRTLLSRELIALGIHNLRMHKLRSLLTALGIIFGVGAVICMLSIGEGASAEQLESIRLLGSRNIIVRSVEPQTQQQSRDTTAMVKQYGLTKADIERLTALPHVHDVVRIRDVADTMVYGSNKVIGTVLGTTENFFDVVNVEIGRGRGLTAADAESAHKVCVIGADVARQLFALEDPIGMHVTVVSPSTGPIPYMVVGVLADVRTAGSPAKGKGMRDANRDMYIPLSTADLRYGDLKVRRSAGSREMKQVEYSDVYVNMDAEENVIAVSKLAERALSSFHKNQDYQITVPLELLIQAEETKRLWQTVLGSIAGISLLVGGIGIMNIMLASVTERTREIGIRRALGAKRYHITAQFLIETVILSVSGGIIGIVLGVGFAWIVTWYANFQTIVPWWAAALSFVVSAMIGIGFGLYPARAAARLDPIEALRYE
ncbi:MAG: ABC transporter permease [Phycisphaerae bacterium]